MRRHSLGEPASAASQKRDAEFTEFHNAMFRPLANYSDRLSRGRASGDDIAQETLLQMYRVWSLLLPKDPVQLRNRAFGIAHDRTVSVIRRSVKLDEILRVLKAGTAASLIRIWADALRSNKPLPQSICFPRSNGLCCS